MTVKELIELLKQQPEDMIVALPAKYEYLIAESVRKTEAFVTTEDDYKKMEVIVIEY